MKLPVVGRIKSAGKVEGAACCQSDSHRRKLPKVTRAVAMRLELGALEFMVYSFEYPCQVS